jgi:beta propeller repeat protein
VCTPVRLTGSAGNEAWADVDDGIVVWTSDAREPGAPSPSDIVLHNLATRETLTITKDTPSHVGKRYPRVHDGRIVWEDERFGGTDIVFYELPR